MTPSSAGLKPIASDLSKRQIKVLTTSKDFSIKAGDQPMISNAIELTIEQIGKHLLAVTDADKGINQFALRSFPERPPG